VPSDRRDFVRAHRARRHPCRLPRLRGAGRRGRGRARPVPAGWGRARRPAWRASAENLGRNFLKPMQAGVAAAAACRLLGVGNAVVLLCLGLVQSTSIAATLSCGTPSDASCGFSGHRGVPSREPLDVPGLMHVAQSSPIVSRVELNSRDRHVPARCGTTHCMADCATSAARATLIFSILERFETCHSFSPRAVRV